MVASSPFNTTALIGSLVAASLATSTMAFVPSQASPSTSTSTLLKARPINNNNHRHLTTTSLFHHDDDRNSNTNDRRSFLTSSAASALPILLLSTPSSIKANAISPEQASKSYDTYASTYDNLDGGSVASSLGIDDARRNLIKQARGDVLEIGVGTGLNLDSYRFNNGNGDGGVKSITLVDISEGMLAQAEQRIDQMKSAGIIGETTPVKIVQADATSELTTLFGRNAFDTVVDTFSLCVMGNEGAKRCLDEMRGVVKTAGDGGQILLIENTRASNPLLGAYQDITASAAADVGGKGCVYNQNVGEMIQRTKGLKLAKEEAFAAGLFRSFTCQKI